MSDNSQNVNVSSLENLIEFQMKNNISGLLANGTTAESVTLDQMEQETIYKTIIEFIEEKYLTIAGTGSNSTKKTLEATRKVEDLGYRAVLLVEPYYNGPSSLEIRKEYLEPIAVAHSNLLVIPYIIPGRSGTKLEPQDLALSYNNFGNISAVKEATGDLRNMKLIRDFCGDDFSILSGDDSITYEMMSQPEIHGQGVISVISNVVPQAMSDLVITLLKGNIEEAKKLAEALKPLMDLVTVKTQETTKFGPVLCRSRNPLPIKTLMEILGMNVGCCRQPLGKMTRQGFNIVLKTAQDVYQNTPQLLEPIEEFFDVNLSSRLCDLEFTRGLYYD